MLLPTVCCYEPNVVNNRVLLTTGCCYQPGVVNKGGDKKVGESTFHTLAPTGALFPSINNVLISNILQYSLICQSKHMCIVYTDQ